MNKWGIEINGKVRESALSQKDLEYLGSVDNVAKNKEFDKYNTEGYSERELNEKIAQKVSSSKYIVTVETMVSKYDKNGKSKILEKSEFDDEKKANKYKKELMKKYKLMNHGGYIVNYKDGVELSTNY